MAYYKKGQEEMIGFVLVVGLVMVIGAGLLVLTTLSPERETLQSSDVQQFLESMFQTTVSCEDAAGRDSKRLNELLVLCYQRPEEACGKKRVCEQLNESVGAIIQSGQGIGKEYATTGYALEARYRVSANATVGQERMVFGRAEGSCGKNEKSAEYITRAGQGRGSIHVRMTLCSASK